MSIKERDQCEFIFAYFLDLTRDFDTHDHEWRCPWISTSTMYDDSSEFIYQFDKKFPGRVPDPMAKLAQARLTKRLKQLVDDHWIDRHRQGNQIEYHGEAKWQYIYRPPQWLLRECKDGKSTPRSLANQYCGVKE